MRKIFDMVILVLLGLNSMITSTVAETRSFTFYISTIIIVFVLFLIRLYLQKSDERKANRNEK